MKAFQIKSLNDGTKLSKPKILLYFRFIFHQVFQAGRYCFMALCLYIKAEGEDEPPNFEARIDACGPGPPRRPTKILRQIFVLYLQEPPTKRQFPKCILLQRVRGRGL